MVEFSREAKVELPLGVNTTGNVVSIVLPSSTAAVSTAMSCSGTETVTTLYTLPTRSLRSLREKGTLAPVQKLKWSGNIRWELAELRR
jgi:hypothetical protein